MKPGLLPHAGQSCLITDRRFYSGISERFPERTHILSPDGYNIRTDIHALPISRLNATIPKPFGKQYPKHPKSIGEHIRKKRIESKLLQEDVAKIIGVSTDTITLWENNKTRPMVHHMPYIIAFLGYCPISFNDSTLAQSLKQYRYSNGLSHKKLGKILGVDGSTIGSWETGRQKPGFKMSQKLKMIIIK